MSEFVILVLAAVTDIDTSGIHAFEELYKSLHKREVQVIDNHRIRHFVHHW